MTEIIMVAVFAAAYLLGTHSSRREIRVLQRQIHVLETLRESQQSDNQRLLNTVLLMRQQGQTAPPMDEEWGVYTMSEDAEDE